MDIQYIQLICLAGDTMRSTSFAHYVIRCQANPWLAQKSTLDMYKRYQRLKLRPRWLNRLLLWH
ncbi:hypothetical protein GCM10023337_05320 [Paenalcaligenes hermetiae]|uniref:Uncharacterized protein n=1 Tax=Paenalcaligenes hermetiae TaxID=1157987 RepID=A0ABP9LYU5_9BURK